MPVTVHSLKEGVVDFFFGSNRFPMPSRYASKYASALWCAGNSWRFPSFPGGAATSASLLEVILNSHCGDGRADARESVHHEANQRSVEETDEPPGID